MLNDKIDLHIYDVQEHISDFEDIKLEHIIPAFELIIGSSGYEVITRKMFSKLKHGCILVSASSSDREFSAVDLRKQIPRTDDCHKDIFVNDVWLLNSGFPINFDGKKNSVSPEKIQLTRALIFSAICLCMKNNYPKKIIDVDSGIQIKIIEKFKRIDYVTK